MDVTEDIVHGLDLLAMAQPVYRHDRPTQITVLEKLLAAMKARAAATETILNVREGNLRGLEADLAEMDSLILRIEEALATCKTLANNGASLAAIQRLETALAGHYHDREMLAVPFLNRVRVSVENSKRALEQHTQTVHRVENELYRKRLMIKRPRYWNPRDNVSDSRQ